MNTTKEVFHSHMGDMLGDYSLNERGEYSDMTTHLCWVSFQLGHSQGVIDEMNVSVEALTRELEKDGALPELLRKQA